MSSIYYSGAEKLPREDREGRIRTLIYYINGKLETLGWMDMDAQDHEYMTGADESELRAQFDASYDHYEDRKEMLKAMLEGKM